MQLNPAFQDLEALAYVLRYKFREAADLQGGGGGGGGGDLHARGGGGECPATHS